MYIDGNEVSYCLKTIEQALLDKRDEAPDGKAKEAFRHMACGVRFARTAVRQIQLAEARDKAKEGV